MELAQVLVYLQTVILAEAFSFFIVIRRFSYYFHFPKHKIPGLENRD
jgi:hypothetical protein